MYMPEQRRRLRRPAITTNTKTMSIQTIRDSKVLRKYFRKLNRKGITERVTELAYEIVKADTPQQVMKLAGKIRALTIACKEDSYWDEKQYIGYSEMLDEATINTKE